jgi:hypothetical protein
MARRLSREAMVILEGGVDEFDIDLNMKRLQNFQILIILAWLAIIWLIACMNNQGFIRGERH